MTRRLLLSLCLVATACSSSAPDPAPSLSASPDPAPSVSSPSETAACPTEPDPGTRWRFPVGASPFCRVPGPSSSALCQAEFQEGGVVAKRQGADGQPELYLASAGMFKGGCPGADPLDTFES